MLHTIFTTAHPHQESHDIYASLAVGLIGKKQDNVLSRRRVDHFLMLISENNTPLEVTVVLFNNHAVQ